LHRDRHIYAFTSGGIVCFESFVHAQINQAGPSRSTDCWRNGRSATRICKIRTTSHSPRIVVVRGGFVSVSTVYRLRS
jgi:hypothetical protein